MTAYVFLGPTLPAEEARAVLDAVYLPPVRQGDVYRVAALGRAHAIGIIDGYFQSVPAVWHKEILWAMAEGIAVFGGASMGALRAAELAAFGMVGVGAIFEAYRDGVLEPYSDETFEDDDEVAVLHGPSEVGYLPLSEALVNIRRTLAAAEADGVIDAGARGALVGVAKRLFYQERSYDRILHRAAAENLPAGTLAALRAWLPTGRVDQKRADAVAVLTTMRAAGPGPCRVRYRFADTTFWQQARSAIDAEAEGEAPELEELRLQPDAYLAARARAVTRLLEPDRRRVPAHADADRCAGGWSGLTPPEGAADSEGAVPVLRAAAGEWAHRRLAEQLPQALIERYMLGDLRASGADAPLRERARAKREALAAVGPERPVPVADLMAWYFGRLRRPVPEDLATYARDLDFATVDAFCRAVLGERLFETHEAAMSET